MSAVLVMRLPSPSVLQTLQSIPAALSPLSLGSCAEMNVRSNNYAVKSVYMYSILWSLRVVTLHNTARASKLPYSIINYVSAISSLHVLADHVPLITATIAVFVCPRVTSQCKYHFSTFRHKTHASQ